MSLVGTAKDLAYIARVNAQTNVHQTWAMSDPRTGQWTDKYMAVVVDTITGTYRIVLYDYSTYYTDITLTGQEDPIYP